MIECLICPKCKGSNKIRVNHRCTLICVECNFVFTFDDALRTLKGENVL